ncbi:hypothetical protein [Flavobacterium daemonense]|uniref:hypothetical protein n=1 Tax=Flavobacterium daemonense TaxID=1393049 RepID=UPI001B870289|nr:hypothetical protein [Flavobacterium daemonense]
MNHKTKTKPFLNLYHQILMLSLLFIAIISNQNILGITGGAIDSNESEPRPVEYRNILITPAK